MRAPVGSLLDQTGQLAVRRQIRYGAERGVPWGVSESGYFIRDLEITYQYSNFGVPGLGLRRGLGEDVVVAPYAAALAAMVDPTAAVRNFERLGDAGACSAYGFYEALDYTPARLPEGASVAIVRTHMAHHHGMILVALANALQHGRMRARFHAEPRVQATELLLQERTPPRRRRRAARAEEVTGSVDPIVVVRIDRAEDVGLVRQLLRAHEYWRMKRLAVDLVIVNERPPSYGNDLQSLLETVVRTRRHEGHGRRYSAPRSS